MAHRFRQVIIRPLGITGRGKIRGVVIERTGDKDGKLAPLAVGHVSTEFLLKNLREPNIL